MDYGMEVKPAILTLTVPDDPEARRLACEREIAATLEKYGCVLLIHTAAKSEEAPK